MRESECKALIAAGVVSLAVAALLLYPVAHAQTSNSATTEVLVLTTATQMPATRSAKGRSAVEIQNLGPNAIYCAFSSAAAVVNKARKIDASGGVWAVDAPSNVGIWCIAATAAQVTGAATVVSELLVN